MACEEAWEALQAWCRGGWKTLSPGWARSLSALSDVLPVPSEAVDHFEHSFSGARLTDDLRKLLLEVGDIGIPCALDANPTSIRPRELVVVGASVVGIH
jgi:hypothetical protein